MNAQEFQFAPPGKFARIFPLAIGVLAPLAIAAVLATTPAPLPWLAVLPALIALPVVAAVLAWAMYRRRIRIRDGFIAYGLFPWRS